jgi:Kip1 ubiquitination-promoting complex protein 1
MAEGSGSHKRSSFSPGLAVLLSGDEAKISPQKSHLVSYHDEIGHQAVERTIEHIFDLPHKSVVRPPGPIDVGFVRSILRNQATKFDLDWEKCNCEYRGSVLIVDRGAGQSKVVLDDSSICGEFKSIRGPLLVESSAPFSSARANACVWKGKWMYEVTLETSGVQQLGWATISSPFTDQKGVGDADDSYSFDGRRVTKWNNDPKPYGQPWAVGYVIGCCIDLDAGETSFYRNGVSLGVAFAGIHNIEPKKGYYPAISLSEGERCHLNFGSHPFRYPVDGFDPIESPPRSRMFMTYLLRCLFVLLEVQNLEKSESAYFEKLRRVKKFAPLQELFHPISEGICAEFFSAVEGSKECLEYTAWGVLTTFLLDLFKVCEPYDFSGLDQVLELFLQFQGCTPLLQELIVALSCFCKTAPLVLTECPYSGSYPFLTLACHLLRHKDVMHLWWDSQDFAFSFEGFLTRKIPNKQDLQCLIPSVWWPGSSEDEVSMTMASTTLSDAIKKIEEMHRELCSLVICFTPSASPPQPPGSIFRSFVQNSILKARGGDHRMVVSGTFNNSILVSLYTVILHLLSEGFSMDSYGPASLSKVNCGTGVGFLHKGGKRRFSTQLLFRNDAYYNIIPRIGGSPNILMYYQADAVEDELQWDEGCMDDEDTRVTHTTIQKPCCCSITDVTEGIRYKYNAKYRPSTSKGPCKPMPERSSHVTAECSGRSLGDDIEDKTSTSTQSEIDYVYQTLQNLESIPIAAQSSSEALKEEELLDIMLLLYHLGISPNFRKAFYFMSQQSQSISLLEETDRQIREKSCAEQVRRLKEARNSYHEDLVDCIRHCVWYRATLFSPWKQRGMYATCMWVVELLLVLSESKIMFQYVPEFYVESLVDCFHALRRSDPPFVSPAVFLKQGLASFVPLVVKHFDDTRIANPDLKDLLLQSISVLVQYKEFMHVFENNQEAINGLPRSLLSAFDNRSWIPVTNILFRLCKGSGFASSKNAESQSSATFQVLLRETCIHEQELFFSFLNRLFNTLSWTMTEFSMSIREMQDKHQVADLQQRKCSVIFDISCNLARILEFCTREIPCAFLMGPDMNLRRLTELIVFILNHIISSADAEFFDMTLRRPGQQLEKTNRTMILAPLVGIILNLMECSNKTEHRELHDVMEVFASMDCPATIHFGLQYLLSYNWSNVLRGDASVAKLARLEEFSQYFRHITMAVNGKEEHNLNSGDEDEDDTCCICYNCDSDATFQPCHHKSCFGCISRHLLNSQRCFFCNAVVTSVTRIGDS